MLVHPEILRNQSEFRIGFIITPFMWRVDSTRHTGDVRVRDLKLNLHRPSDGRMTAMLIGNCHIYIANVSCACTYVCA